MFTNQELKRLIIPLFLEQLLISLVGMSDIFIVGFTGEANVSGVSLVNAFNTIFINLFVALGAGGAVVVSQYIGKKDMKQAGEAASQLFLASAVFSVLISAAVLAGSEALLRFLFGKVESDVMAACVTYLRISAYSYPALAVYNAGAALHRSLGKTSTTMYISIVANIINVTVTILCFSGHHPVRYAKAWILKINGSLQKKILGIAVPNGVESGVFQLVAMHPEGAASGRSCR